MDPYRRMIIEQLMRGEGGVAGLREQTNMLKSKPMPADMPPGPNTEGWGSWLARVTADHSNPRFDRPDPETRLFDPRQVHASKNDDYGRGIQAPLSGPYLPGHESLLFWPHPYYSRR